MIRGTRRWLMQLLAGFAALPGITAADDLFFGRKLKSRCCLPDYGYDQTAFSNPVTGRSLRPVAAASEAALVAANPGASAARRVFQIRPGTLAVDHCSVSGVTVTLASSGEWMLSCTATQDPASVEPSRRAQFERFLRNEFRLQLRPVLLNSSIAADNATVGPQELQLCEDQTFWVRKGEIRKLALQGTSLELPGYFADIAQINVHFSIR